MEHSPDTAAVFRELRRRIEERHQRVRELYGPEEVDALQQAVDSVARSWFVSSHNPVTWSLPVLGRFVALGKRALRLALRWYINPIVDQQNNFNASVARAVLELSAHYRRLAADVAELKAKRGEITQ